MYKLYYLSKPHCPDAHLIVFGDQKVYNRDSKWRPISLKCVVHDGKIWYCRHEEQEECIASPKL